MLFERLDAEIAPMRTIYDELIQDPGKIERTLQAGAHKARAIATPFTARLRHAVGLRPLDSRPTAAKAAKATRSAAPSFKQYREQDGLFYFKLLDAQGHLLLQSTGFASPREAAQTVTRLQQQGAGAIAELQSQLIVAGDPQVLAQALGWFSTLAD
jgi:tryptophanyl-tRNA synthetase